MSEQVQPPRGTVAGCLVVLLVAVAAVAAGVVWFVSVLDDPRRQVAANIHDYTDLCGGRPIPGAAAYVPGAGSHPIAVFGGDQDEHGGSSGIQITFGASDDRAVFNPANPGSVQLVACTQRVEDGPAAGTCQYQDTTAPIHRSTVEITVYEARTAEQVGEPIRLVGQDMTCPTFITYRGTPTVFSKPTVEQFRSVLAPLVTG
jgi:hypothetical protein